MLNKFYLSHRSMKLQNKCISTYHTLSFSTNSIAWMRYWLIREISFLGPILKHFICFFIFGRFNHHGSVFRNYFCFMMIFSKMRRYNIILKLIYLGNKMTPWNNGLSGSATLTFLWFIALLQPFIITATLLFAFIRWNRGVGTFISLLNGKIART